MTHRDILAEIDGVIAWEGRSPDAMSWSPDEWTDIMRPGLLARLAEDSRRPHSEIGWLLDQLHEKGLDGLDVATAEDVVMLFVPTAKAILGPALSEAMAHVEQAPLGLRLPVLAQLAQIVIPSVAQVVR